MPRGYHIGFIGFTLEFQFYALVLVVYERNYLNKPTLAVGCRVALIIPSDTHTTIAGYNVIILLASVLDNPVLRRLNSLRARMCFFTLCFFSKMVAMYFI